jgi:hypothetical protein
MSIHGSRCLRHGLGRLSPPCPEREDEDNDGKLGLLLLQVLGDEPRENGEELVEHALSEVRGEQGLQHRPGHPRHVLPTLPPSTT